MEKKKQLFIQDNNMFQLSVGDYLSESFCDKYFRRITMSDVMNMEHTVKRWGLKTTVARSLSPYGHIPIKMS